MKPVETEKSTSLTTRQLAALHYLVASPLPSEAARLANISRATLWRWMNDDDFRQELDSLRDKAADLARAELKGLMLKGIVFLAGALEDADPGIRLRASRAALSLGLRASDLENIQRRIGLLDDAMALRKSNRR